MGKRGPLPQLTAAQTTKLQDLTPPSELGEQAQAYWNKHAPWLAKNGLLTVQTYEAFVCLCDLWGRLRSFLGEDTSRTYLDLLRAYQHAAKDFRLSPTEKAGLPAERHETKNLFDDEDL